MIATRRVTVIWVLLLALTFSSVGIEQSLGAESAAAIAIIGIAMFKVYLIGNNFMDLRVAPSALRLAFGGYVLAVFGALVIIIEFLGS